jgi:multidrug efflux pump
MFSQLLTLYTTPVMYLYLDRWRLRWQAFRERPSVKRPEPVAVGD